MPEPPAFARLIAQAAVETRGLFVVDMAAQLVGAGVIGWALGDVGRWVWILPAVVVEEAGRRDLLRRGRRAREQEWNNFETLIAAMRRRLNEMEEAERAEWLTKVEEARRREAVEIRSADDSGHRDEVPREDEPRRDP